MAKSAVVRRRKSVEAPKMTFTADEIVLRNVDDLIPFPNNPKIHTAEQIDAIAANISRFGFDQPILIDDDDTILKGHGRQLGARKAGCAKVPTIVHKGLSFEEKWAIVISDNALPAMTGFDQVCLNVGLTSLAKIDFDLKLAGLGHMALSQQMLAAAAEPEAKAAKTKTTIFLTVANRHAKKAKTAVIKALDEAGIEHNL